MLIFQTRFEIKFGSYVSSQYFLGFSPLANQWLLIESQVASFFVKSGWQHVVYFLLLYLFHVYDNDDDDNDNYDNDDHHDQGTLSGDIHFDDDEDWTVGSERGTDVIQVL